MVDEPAKNNREVPIPYRADRELVARLLLGSAEAWFELVRDYTGLIRSRVESVAATCGLGKDRHVHDDLIAELFAALLSNDCSILRSYQGRSSLATYLGVVATRIALRHSLTRSKMLLPQESNPGPIDHRFEDPQLAAQRREQSHAVQTHLQNLPEKQRQMIRLYFEEGCSFKEISQKLNVPIGTIGPTLMRAEEQLRRNLSTNPSWKPLQANEPS